MKKSILLPVFWMILCGQSGAYSVNPPESGKRIVACLMYLDINQPAEALIQAKEAVKASKLDGQNYYAGYAHAALGISYQRDYKYADIGINSNFSAAIRYLKNDESSDVYDFYIVSIIDNMLNGNYDSSFTKTTLINFIRQHQNDVNPGHEERAILACLVLKQLLNLNFSEEKELNNRIAEIAEHSANPILNARSDANSSFTGLKDHPGTALVELILLRRALDQYYTTCYLPYIDKSLLVKPCFQSPEIRPVELTMYMLSPQQEDHLFANIEVSASGVKYSVIQRLVDREGEYLFNIIGKDAVSTGFDNFTPLDFKKTIENVIRFKDTIQQRYHIPDQKIFYSISSGAEEAAKSARRTGLLDTLKTEIRTWAKTDEVKIITVEEETKLTLLGVLPRKVFEKGRGELYKHLILDIGTGNTKGGYYRKATDENYEFNYFYSHWACGDILKSVPDFNSIQDLSVKIQRTVDQAMRETGRGLKSVLNNGSYKENTNVIVTGGIFWAIAYRMKPKEAIDRPFVILTLADIQEFKRMCIEDYQRLVDYEQYLYLFDKPEEREALKNEFIKISKEFPQTKCIAGATLAEAIVRELNISGIPKTYRFARNGVVGWTTGYIIRKMGENNL